MSLFSVGFFSLVSDLDSEVHALKFWICSSGLQDSFEWIPGFPLLDSVEFSTGSQIAPTSYANRLPDEKKHVGFIL